MFRRGLKENVKDEIMRDDREVETLGDIISIAVDLDDKLYKRAIEKRYDRIQRGSAGNYIGNRHGSKYRKHRSNQQSSFDSYGLTLMELDSTERRRRYNPRGKK